MKKRPYFYCMRKREKRRMKKYLKKHLTEYKYPCIIVYNNTRKGIRYA